MNLQKCDKCDTKFLENTSNFYKRTKNPLLRLSPICRCCARISKAIVLPDEKKVVLDITTSKSKPKRKRVKKSNMDLKNVSLALLQRKFKLSFEGAKKMKQELFAT